jgi:tetratricopeptide (TPR) repeat protein
VLARSLFPWAVLCCLLAGLTARSATASVNLAEAQSHAVAANRAYEAGDLDEAVRLYQASLDAGLDNAIIHYNLGNAYYKRGDVGKAIASYLRALRRNPRDGAARANLAQAQTLLRDEALAPLRLPVFLKPLGWIYGRLSLNDWAWSGLIAIAVLAMVAILGQWARLPRAPLRRLRWALLCAAVVAFTMMGLHFRAEVERDTAVVVADEVDVRSGPGPDYNLAFKIHEGLQVFVAERREGWVQIHLGGELVGWVPKDQLELL